MLKIYDLLSDEVKNNYQHMTPKDVEILLDGNWDHGWKYEEIIGFVKTARATKYVKVNDFGIRQTADGEEIVINNAVWMFGGSTSLGCGVKDTKTIPYLVQDKSKKSSVINFGRGYYF